MSLWAAVCAALFDAPRSMQHEIKGLVSRGTCSAQRAVATTFRVPTEGCQDALWWRSAWQCQHRGQESGGVEHSC